MMTEERGYWMHDGNLKRPYALLTGGKISNFYANCSVITRNPRLLNTAAEDLLKIFAAVLPPPDVFAGSAYGGITLAYELARHKEAEAWFTVKGAGDTMVLDRFDFGNNTTNVVMVEDVITTFKTTRASIAAIKSPLD